LSGGTVRIVENSCESLTEVYFIVNRKGFPAEPTDLAIPRREFKARQEGSFTSPASAGKLRMTAKNLGGKTKNERRFQGARRQFKATPLSVYFVR